MYNFQFVKLVEINVPEDMQHIINSWSKLDFIPRDIKWNNPSFTIFAELDHPFIKKAIAILEGLINQAHIDNNFTEVVNPKEFLDVLKTFDEKNDTKFSIKYEDQLKQLQNLYDGK